MHRAKKTTDEDTTADMEIETDDAISYEATQHKDAGMVMDEWQPEEVYSGQCKHDMDLNLPLQL